MSRITKKTTPYTLSNVKKGVLLPNNESELGKVPEINEEEDIDVWGNVTSAMEIWNDDIQRLNEEGKELKGNELEQMKKVVIASKVLAKSSSKLVHRGVRKPALLATIKKAWGRMKNGDLYKCKLEDNKIVKGSHKLKPGVSLEDIATEESGEKEGKKWSSWRHNVTKDFIRGTFNWLPEQRKKEIK